MKKFLLGILREMGRALAISLYCIVTVLSFSATVHFELEVPALLGFFFIGFMVGANKIEKWLRQ